MNHPARALSGFYSIQCSQYKLVTLLSEGSRNGENIQQDCLCYKSQCNKQPWKHQLLCSTPDPPAEVDWDLRTYHPYALYVLVDITL